MYPLVLKNIRLSYYGKMALDIPSLIASESLGIIGGSGSGKTNILKVIAGLEQIDSGEIYINGKEVGDYKIKDRNISLLSMQTPLFKNKSIYENLIFPLKKRRKDKKNINQAIEKVQDLLSEEIVSNFYNTPCVLNEKDKALLLIARALIKNPSIILVDEPHLIEGDTEFLLKKLKDCGTFFVVTSFDFSLIKDIVKQFIILRRGQIVFNGSLLEIESSTDKFIRLTCFPMEFLSKDLI